MIDGAGIRRIVRKHNESIDADVDLVVVSRFYDGIFFINVKRTTTVTSRDDLIILWSIEQDGTCLIVARSFGSIISTGNSDDVFFIIILRILPYSDFGSPCVADFRR